MKKLALSLFFVSAFLSANAQTDTIRVNDSRLLMKNIKPINRQYLVYRQRSGNGAKKQLSVWQRNVEIKDQRLIIKQNWYGGDTITRQLFSVCDLQNFRPIYHYSKNFRSGVEAYNISGSSTIGADSVANNQRKEFSNT
jgi:hypothetical protein